MMKVTRRAAVVVAFALASLTGVAVAQPFHRGMAAGDVGMAIAALKGQLNLNTSQQAMWDNAIAASKAARESGRANLAKMHDAMTAELGKTEPDLAAVAAAADDAQSKNLALRQQVRSQWLTLYATFTPDQKALVRDALKNRMARMEQFRQKMLQRHAS
ncbi:MAG TPA: periplasmic heavy metal sensor [Casimicrobiaceae bacterium]|nr:periplasmic heavy metal sensor [Casimicrobiaceae bacterium]